MSNARLKRLHNAIETLAKDAGLELVEATCTGNDCRTHVHVFVHGDQGVSAKQLARLHRAVEASIEENDLLIPGSFQLELSTPGVKRPLKSARDFERNIGREVHVFLDEPFAGELEWEGFIVASKDPFLELKVEGEIRKIPVSQIDFGKLLIAKNFRSPKKKKKRKKKSSQSGRRQAQV